MRYSLSWHSNIIMTFFKKLTLTITLVSFVFRAGAQDKPVGYWESHLPYNKALGVATDGNTLYAICPQAFFTFAPTNAYVIPVPYSKVEGMSDIGMQCVGFDVATSTAILVYVDGNIDLFKNNTFYNIPDLKIKNVSGIKSVYQVYTENGFAYLSTSLGVLVIDLTNHIVVQTYQFVDISSGNNSVIAVKSFSGSGNYYYAVTPAGLYSINKGNPQIQNFQAWQLIDNNAYTGSASVGSALFLSTGRAVFLWTNNTLSFVYATTNTIQHIDAGNGNLFISEYIDSIFTGVVRIVDPNGNMVDSFTYSGDPLQVVQRQDNSIWIADYFFGLMKRKEGNHVDRYIPSGPADEVSFDLYANKKNLWIAHGGYDESYYALHHGNGISNLDNGRWRTYSRNNYGPLSSVVDFIALAKDEANGILYAASYLNGLFILNKDGTSQLISQNSIFEASYSNANGPDARQLGGVAFDSKSGNLWVTQVQTVDQLYLRTPAGNWYKFSIPGVTDGGPLAIDDNGQAWFIPQGVHGLVVYNANGTLNGDPLKDAYYHLSTGAGSGNLPSNKVLCIAKDKNNDMWIGTDNGIGIAGNCSAPFTQTPVCDANIPIVQYDNYAGYLFAGSTVMTIAVDGANRKWVGTNDGVWLLSPDASKIIYRFTVDNSPLPSNSIRKIAIDGATGDVYIGTEMGLVSFRSTATDGGESNQQVQIFPNPVHSGYTGAIAIKGLTANADVRITDMQGQLVFHTTAFGGQAVWNGVDYTGRRPQTGVYLVFVSSSDGTQTFTGKIVFVQ
jgi:hypothetical protein